MGDSDSDYSFEILSSESDNELEKINDLGQIVALATERINKNRKKLD